MANEVDLFRYSVALPQRSGEDARYQFLSSLQQTLPGFLQCNPCRDGFSHVGAFETQIYQIPTESESRNQHTGCVCSRDKRRHQDGHSLSECSLAVPHPGLRFFSATSTVWGLQRWWEWAFLMSWSTERGLTLWVSPAWALNGKALPASISAS